MEFVFWLIVILILIFEIPKWGFWNFLGLMVLMAVLIIALRIFFEKLAEDKKFRRMTLKVAGVILLLGGCTYLLCNYVFNLYEASVTLYDHCIYDDTRHVKSHDYNKTFIASNDSAALAKVKSYAIRKAKKLPSRNDIPRKIFIYIWLNNCSKSYKVEHSESFAEEISAEISKELHLVAPPKEEPQTMEDVFPIVNAAAADSLEEDTL